MSEEALSEQAYEEAADRTLRALERAAGEIGEIEADLAGGILTIELQDGVKYVINSHRAARQIWMAAERSAWHFDLRDGRWIASRSGDELWAALEGVLSRKLGRPVALAR
ncbi:MAG: iron donor protein CyaY [Polyangiaceae bacterium]|nr:iron donor protein CyaY [Polyangiaceae bacterium]